MAFVQERFFAQLSSDEIATLAQVFNRFAPRAAAACALAQHGEADVEPATPAASDAGSVAETVSETRTVAGAQG